MSTGGIADRFEHDIVSFMRSWAPYGGPPDDEALPEFGLSREQLVRRYQQILAAEAARREWELRRPWSRQRHAAQGERSQGSAHPTPQP